MDYAYYLLRQINPQIQHMTVYHGDGAFSIERYLYATLVAVVLIVWRRGRSFGPALWTLIFGYYLITALRITLFPIHVSGSYAEDLSTLPLYSWVYLNPFDLARYYGPLRKIAYEFALNLLLTVPLGFLLPFVLPFTFRRALLTGVLAGLVIEGTQLLLTLLIRHPHRVIDFYDFLMNAVGVVVGYVLYLIVTALVPALHRRDSTTAP